MVMQMMRKGAGGGLVKFFLFGILGLSVGGLALMDVRGVLQGGSVGGNDVVRVGDETISIRSFDRTLRRALVQYRIQPDQAYKLGLVDELLSGQIRTYLLAQTAKEKGFDLDKELLAMRVAQVVKPNALPGQSMQGALEQLLQRQGMSEDEFVSILKREVTGEYLMQSLRGGFSFDKDLLAGELFKFQNQTRDIQAIFFADKDIKDIEAASQEKLETLYESVKRSRYRIPEYRTIKIAVFDPEKLNIEVEVTPEEVEQAYKDNQDRFTTNEKIILTQSLVDNAEQAKAIYDEVQGGKTLKDAVKSITGSETGYYEKRDFEVAAMIEEMAEAIEGLEAGGVSEPVETMLGHHVFLLDERVEPTVRPLEDVQEEIRAALLAEKHDEEIYEIAQDLDENLDSGVSFEDLTKENEFPLEIIEVGPFDQNGFDKDGEQGMSTVAQDDISDVRETSFEMAEGETTILQEYPSGILAAIKLEKVMPESYKSFDEVKKELADQYVADQRHAKNFENVAKYIAELGTGGSTFEGLAKEYNKGIMNYKSIGLSGEMPSPLNADARPVVFQTALGEYEMVNLEDQFAIIKVSGFDVPEVTQDENVQNALKAIASSADKEMQDDAFLMYLRGLSEKTEPSINQRLIKQAYDKGPGQ